MASEPLLAITCDDVLSRVARITGSKNDSALARAMNVSPQTLFNWRSRGTVPYEAACAFALENGIAIDYVLLGHGAKSVERRSAWNKALVKRLADELEKTAREMRAKYGA